MGRGGLLRGFQHVVLAVLTAWPVVSYAAPAAQWEAVDVAWDCPQTVSTTVATSTKLHVEFNTATGESRSPDLTTMLQTASSQSTYDFYRCALAFSYQLFFDARTKCDSFDPKPALCANPQNFFQHFDDQRTAVAKYGAAAAASGISPFEPGSPAKPALSQAETQRMNAALKQSCQPYVQGENRDKFLDRDYITQQLPTIIQSNACPKTTLAREYLRLLLDSELTPAQCAANATACADRKKAVCQTLRLLATAGLNDEITDHGTNQLATGACPTGNAMDEQMHALAVKLDGIVACEHQIPDDPFGKVVNGKKTGTGIGTQGTTEPHYEVDRLANESNPDDYKPDGGGPVVPKGTMVPVYRASVTYRFNPASEQQTMEQRARDCLTTEPIKSKLRGPSGEFMKINIASPTATGAQPYGAAPQTVDVTTASALTRDHSGSWNAHATCAVILHETLHVMGLVDEYPERQDGVVLDATGKANPVTNIATGPYSGKTTFTSYDCRVLGPGDSVMRSEAAAVDAISRHLTESYCYCLRDTDTACIAKLKKMAATDKSCPAGTSSAKTDYRENDTSDHSPGFHPPTEFIISNSGPAPAKKSSILYPAQFRAVTEPGCIDSNKAYALCSQEAYKTSRTHYGGEYKCGVGLPSACQSGSASWLQ